MAIIKLIAGYGRADYLVDTLLGSLSLAPGHPEHVHDVRLVDGRRKHGEERRMDLLRAFGTYPVPEQDVGHDLPVETEERQRLHVVHHDVRQQTECERWTNKARVNIICYSR